MSFFNGNISTRAILAISLSLVFALQSLSGSAGAAGNGYRISPVRTEVTMSAGETKPVTVYIKNVSESPAELKIVANDFRSRNETGTPALLLNGENLPNYGLKKYLVLPSETVTLAPGEQKAVIVQVKLSPQIKAGGYFGAVRFVPADTDDSKTVNLSASVASLILVRVQGQINEQVSVLSLKTHQGRKESSFYTHNNNLTAVVRFQNNGDIQEQPFGKITLKKGSTTVNSYEINNTDPKGNVLPTSIRAFSVPLRGVGTFGKYKLEGNFGYGSKGELISASTTFYVIPISLIIIAILLVAAIIALIVWRKRSKRYSKRR